GDARTMAHLLKYDSVLGRLDQDVEVGDGKITVGGDDLLLLSERDPKDLPWRDLGVDIVIESTGLFTDREGASGHLEAGAAKGVISAPATDPDVTVVLGVNDDDYDPETHRIISNASCTTNCVAPMAKVLHDALTVEQGFMTTIHAYTAGPRGGAESDPGLDGRRASDRRRDAGAQGQGRRDVDAGPGSRRVSRRPRRFGLAGGERGRGERALQ